MSAFRCRTCHRTHEISVYAVAQLASGYSLTHTCECGATHELVGQGTHPTITQTKKGKRGRARKAKS